MIRTLLLRGMLAGILAGLLVFAFARLVGEPQVEHAIQIEMQLDAVHGDADHHEPEPETITRTIQRGVGLLTGVVLYSVAIGGLFSLVFAFAYGRIESLRPRVLSIVLAGLGFVAIVLVPMVKYPANPPAVGSPDTIGIRTGAYFLLLAFSILMMSLCFKIGRTIRYRVGAWNAALLAGGLYLLLISTIAYFLPVIDEVPAAFPASLLWRFRIAALGIQGVLWTSLGLLFGWFAERELTKSVNPI